MPICLNKLPSLNKFIAVLTALLGLDDKNVFIILYLELKIYYLFGLIISFPPIYGLKATGIFILPSSL